VLDGDDIRQGLSRDLGFTEADRTENVRRVAEVARLMIKAGLLVVISLISPLRAHRQMARHLFQEEEFFEVFVDVPLETAERRDPKGLYQLARAGALTNFTGITSPYEIPVHPDLRLCTDELGADESAEKVIELLRKHGRLTARDDVDADGCRVPPVRTGESYKH
jgi:bifunctional enzyme CysN/CysC